MMPLKFRRQGLLVTVAAISAIALMGMGSPPQQDEVDPEVFEKASVE
ncbi:MAG: hypothetical protein ACI9BD_001407, partial [Candidatus Marinamargulisbacteria bacterium]